MLRERRIDVPEEHVIALWLRELRPERVFSLCGGRALRVIDAGIRNLHDGPDFLDARIVLDGRLMRGAIEVHTREGDWQRHGHGGDVRYRDVILHVCLYAEPTKRTDIPVLVLASEMAAPLRTSWASVRKTLHAFPCAAAKPESAAADFGAMLALTAAERFSRKCERINRRHSALCREMSSPEAWRQVMYESVARAAGYGGNEKEMEALAAAVPLVTLAGIEPAGRYAYFLEAAGFRDGDGAPLFERHVWRSARVLPHNRVRHRLRWFAGWCGRLNERVWWRAAIATLNRGERDTRQWGTLFTTTETAESPGRDRVCELLVNVCAPLFRVYAEGRGDGALAHKAAALYFTCVPAPHNRHTRALGGAFDRKCIDTQDQQGMTELHGNYCLTGRCQACLCRAHTSF